LVTPQDRTGNNTKIYIVKIKRDPATIVANATGGNLSYFTDTANQNKIYEIHTFLVDGAAASGGVTVYSGNEALSFVEGKCPARVDVLVVAGGGGSGYGDGSNQPGGGGGAGGLIYKTGYEITKNSYDITVGNGGDPPNGHGGGTNGATWGANGGNSLFDAAGSSTRLEAPGGGGGASHAVKTFNLGADGGSGGGGTAHAIGGSSVSTFFFNESEQGADDQIAFGKAGGGAAHPGSSAGSAGGGGGATTQGDNVEPFEGGNGGKGKRISISGTPVWYAAGGAGTGGSGYNTNDPPLIEGFGAKEGNAGAPNTGGGGSGVSVNGPGGSGGSGIVIVRWELQ
jgi:hypothetical protein